MAPAPREAKAPGHQARYLCRIRDIIPVGRWKLELPSQDLIEEIFLEIVLTVSDKDTEEEAESADSSCSTKCSREEWGARSGLVGVGTSRLRCICDDTFSPLDNELPKPFP